MFNDFAYYVRVVLPLIVVSLLIPVIAWGLRCHLLISAIAQRRIEMAWLISLTIAHIGFWVTRLQDNHDFGFFSALYDGYYIFIVLVSLVVSAVRRWRCGDALAGQWLFRSLLVTAFRMVLLPACGILILVLLSTSNRVPPVSGWSDWMGGIFLFCTFVLNLMILGLIQGVRRYREGSLRRDHSQGDIPPNSQTVGDLNEQLPPWVSVAALMVGLAVMTLGLLPWVWQFFLWRSR